MHTYAHATPERPPTTQPLVKPAQPSELCSASRCTERPESVLTPSGSADWNCGGLQGGDEGRGRKEGV